MVAPVNLALAAEDPRGRSEPVADSSAPGAGKLTELAWHCRSRFNSYGSIVRRLLDPRTNLRNPTRFAIYCLYNPLYRREAFKKQDMILGKR